ncbi:methyl-accepting chemotaxis protein [Longirhabdus pacifica]|uniref:methyl-accepting chemotaxis protein n=1 Tax=Longirhabdus pacifica TaxID=2305227 RepID=UPI0013E8A98C|nr:methyl-accepting chemotaxis protein [Longirhabdus pacifica]
MSGADHAISLSKKRNIWCITVFGLLVTFTQIFNFFVQKDIISILQLIGIMVVIILPLAFVIYKNITLFKTSLLKTHQIIKYVTVAIISVFLALVMINEPHIINLLFFFVFVSIVSIYQDKMINVFSYVITLALILTYNDSIVSSNLSDSDILYLVMPFSFVTLVTLLQSSFNQKMQEDLQVQKMKAEKNQEELKVVLSHIKSSIDLVKQYQQELNSDTEVVNQAAADIFESIEDISKSYVVQSDQTEAIYMEMETTNEKVDDMTHSAVQMNNYIQSTKDATIESGERIQLLENDLEAFNSNIETTTNIMKNLENRTESIEKIITTISDIASKTNLLSLNASIEAARAGEHGKGFAVVATEIKQLAESSKEASNNISEMLLTIRTDTQKSYEIISRSQQDIVKNREGMGEVKELFDTITTHMENFHEKTRSLQEFITNVQAMLQEVGAKAETNSAITQQNKAGIEQVRNLVMNQKEGMENIYTKFNSLESKLSELNA